MNFINTADLHVGRQFHNDSLLENQFPLLKQLVALANDAHPRA